MRQTDLVERVQAYDPDADEALLNKAYVYAMTAHGKQFRASGDPYFTHPLEVAAILTELKLDVPTIVTALLHDTVEDTLVTYADVEGKIRRGNRQSGRRRHQALPAGSVFRAHQAGGKFPQADARHHRDIRVLLVKLADRLHNMRTLGYIEKSEKRRRIAQETWTSTRPWRIASASRICAKSWRIWPLPNSTPRPATRSSRGISRGSIWIGGDRSAASRIRSSASSPSRAGGLGLWPRKTALFDLAQDAAQESRFRATVRYFRLSRHCRLDRRLLPGARHHPYQLANGAGTLQGFISTPKPNGYRSITPR